MNFNHEEFVATLEKSLRETPEGNFPYLLVAEHNNVMSVHGGSFLPERTREENIAFAFAGMERDFPGASPVVIYKRVGGEWEPIFVREDPRRGGYLN